MGCASAVQTALSSALKAAEDGFIEDDAAVAHLGRDAYEWRAVRRLAGGIGGVAEEAAIMRPPSAAARVDEWASFAAEGSVGAVLDEARHIVALGRSEGGDTPKDDEAVILLAQ